MKTTTEDFSGWVAAIIDSRLSASIKARPPTATTNGPLAFEWHTVDLGGRAPTRLERVERRLAAEITRTRIYLAHISAAVLARPCAFGCSCSCCRY